MARMLFWGLAACAWLTATSPAQGRFEDETIRAAHEVLQEFMGLQIRQIPDSLLAEAHGVAIIPDVVKLGFVVGGQRGHGVVIMRERDGSWRAPLFVTITGGSIGWQVGAQSTDFVLVFKSQKSVEGLLRGKFTLGADAAVAAGPVGRRAGAATDAELKAEIYSYSRSRGLFAGVSLEGSALQVDHAANATYYGPAGNGPVPPTAVKLVEIIASLTNHRPAPPAATPGQTLAPSPVFNAPAMHHAPLNGASHFEDLRARLASAAASLSPLLDESWRSYLALPAEVFQPGGRPALAQVETTLARFNEVARNRQYHALSDRPQFHETHRLLQALLEDLRASPSMPALPPPPVAR